MTLLLSECCTQNEITGFNFEFVAKVIAEPVSRLSWIARKAAMPFIFVLLVTDELSFRCTRDLKPGTLHGLLRDIDWKRLKVSAQRRP
jgi:hypothetical protein